MHDTQIELVVLEVEGGAVESIPHAWITAHPPPLATKLLTLR
jgi:hypothetical protein